MSGVVERLRDAAALPNGLYAEAAAAITDLLAALEDIVDAWDGIDDPFTPKMPRLAERARAEIAKVKGNLI